ncbi:hypothetical protein EYF80_038169 [Liparis tanakae]|uniref:Uncharacterized protein n=1 Tax=Liparis tanakae TaxID=230148 RepID=A0A4Z2GFD0_9TELE|nr:hypothetical protein EYF80_038169 [Liparis tanakae]
MDQTWKEEKRRKKVEPFLGGGSLSQELLSQELLGPVVPEHFWEEHLVQRVDPRSRTEGRRPKGEASRSDGYLRESDDGVTE